jgi:FkbM family methyltransferase
MKKLRYLLTIPLFILKEPSNKGYRFKHLMLALGWQLWKRVGGPRIIKTIDNGALFILDPQSGNSVGAIYTRVYSSIHVNFVRKHILTNGTMIDVGAHAGLYSLLFKHLIRRTVLFEPAHDTLKLLRRNMAINDIEFDIKSSAVGSKTGWCQFAITGDNSATNHISVSGVPTPMCALDDVLHDINDMTFLKIDTEGGELGVLKGAELLLKRNSSSIIQVEVTGDRNPVVNLLKNYGYKVYGLDNQGNPKEYGSEFEIIDDLIAFGPTHPYAIT